MDWKWVLDVANTDSILELFKNETMSGDQRFHAIIYCGVVKELPLDMGLILDGTLIAPVEVDEKHQQLFLFTRQDGTEMKIKRISEFNVKFEKVQ